MSLQTFCDTHWLWLSKVEWVQPYFFSVLLAELTTSSFILSMFPEVTPSGQPVFRR